MRHPLRSLLTLAVAALAVPVLGGATISPAPAAGSADSAAVAAAVRDFHAALAKGDSVTALKLLAADAIILESGGVESRSEYRSHHLAEDIQFAQAVATSRAPLAVTVRGSVAWTATTSSSRGQFNGRPINSAGAESMVLSKERGGWRIRSIHWSSHRLTP